MKPPKRPPLNFTEFAPEDVTNRAPWFPPEAPPLTEEELAILDAPKDEAPVELASEESPNAAQPGREIAPPATPPLTPVARARAAKPSTPSAWPVWLTASLLSALCVAAPLAFAVGYREKVSPLESDPFALVLFALMVIGPLGMIWIGAVLFRQGQRLASEVRRTHDLAQTMVAPAALAISETGGVVESVRGQITAAAGAASEARETMLALRQALSEETERLSDAAASAARTSTELATTLGRQRDALSSLSGELDARAAAVSDAITRQARMVAEASDLAETQLREAEASLTARAADMAAAAGEAGDAARVAGEDLARQIARLETAGVGVSDQMRLAEEGLSQQRAALVTVAHAIRTDQEDFAAHAETRTAQLTEVMTQAATGAADLGDTASRSAQVLTQLIQEAASRMAEAVAAAESERTRLTLEVAETIAPVSAAVSAERNALAEELRAGFESLTKAADNARLATDAHAEAARLRVDQLSETAFDAHQKADAIFEARLTEARDLIEQSAQMVEQAGMVGAQRLVEGVASAKAVMSDLENLLAELDARTAGLPAQARERADAVRAAVEESMGDLLASARKTAEETQAIDEAFQVRVRRNYDMLTEAVKLSGLMANAPQRFGGPPLTPPVGLTPPATPAPRPQPVTQPGQQAAFVPPTSEEAGLRPRLKLTPTASDEEFRQVFDAAGGRNAPEPEQPVAEERGDWTWKGLLDGIDGDAGAGIDGQADQLTGEIIAMGIDPAALLSRARVEDIGAVVQRGDVAAAREMVKRLAPAAIRRLVRRLFSDAALRGQSERFLARFSDMLKEATERDRGGVLAAALLNSENGRTWLLLDAASGDLV